MPVIERKHTEIKPSRRVPRTEKTCRHTSDSPGRRPCSRVDSTHWPRSPSLGRRTDPLALGACRLSDTEFVHDVTRAHSNNYTGYVNYIIVTYHCNLSTMIGIDRV